MLGLLGRFLATILITPQRAYIHSLESELEEKDALIAGFERDLHRLTQLCDAYKEEIRALRLAATQE